MKRILKLIAVILTISSVLALNSIGASAEWRYDVYKSPVTGGIMKAWNYYDDNGKPKVGWFCVDGKWYYGDELHEDDYYKIYIDRWAPSYFVEYVDGKNVSHQTCGSFDYYCGSDGAMKIGWFQAYDRKDANKKNGLHWYYAGSDGKILRNTYTPDGYWVNFNGICG